MTTESVVTIYDIRRRKEQVIILRSRKEPVQFEEEEIRLGMTRKKVKEMLMTETFYYPRFW